MLSDSLGDEMQPDRFAEAYTPRDDSDPVHGLGPCVCCGHDPACGYSAIDRGAGNEWLCHTGSHSCYVGSVTAPISEHP